MNPRHALETLNSGQQRLDKIIELLKISQYSIHDLSITKCKSKKDYCRMNMPFELGLDLGLINSGNLEYSSKKILILENKKYELSKALSDIAGLDSLNHSNNLEQLFLSLKEWSNQTLNSSISDPPLKIFNDYNEFLSSLYLKKLFQFFGNETYAKDSIEKLTISEFIQEMD